MRKDGEGVTISDVGKVLKAVSPLIDKIEEEKKAAYFSMLKELKEMRGKRKKSACICQNKPHSIKIKIKQTKNADTRTCDWTKVSKEQLLKESKQHIRDVEKGMKFLAKLFIEQGKEHDWTKIEYIDEFYKDFKTGFRRQEWWKFHQITERHHFDTKKYIQKDVDLIDVLEQIVDGVMAGLGRSGKYRYKPLDSKLLQKAYRNTARLLVNNIEIEKKEAK